MSLIMQTAWPTGDATRSALLAQFLPDGFWTHTAHLSADEGMPGRAVDQAAAEAGEVRVRNPSPTTPGVGATSKGDA